MNRLHTNATFFATNILAYLLGDCPSGSHAVFARVPGQAQNGLRRSRVCPGFWLPALKTFYLCYVISLSVFCCVVLQRCDCGAELPIVPGAEVVAVFDGLVQ